MKRKHFFLPVLVLALGIGWLLNVAGVLPRVNWLWCGFLGAAGLCILLAGRFTRGAFVGGFFLIAAALLTFLRSLGKLPGEWEWPILLVVLGSLMIFGQFLPPETRPKPNYPEKNDGGDE